MAKRILTVGFDLASDEIESEDFQSRTSLLDWDIILLHPDIANFSDWQDEDYLGKPCLSDGKSFAFRESCEHWRREIKEAVEAGKSVIVFLPEMREIYVATGKKEHSGTGRNQKTTRLVELKSNYSVLPQSLKPVASRGKSMKLVDKGAEALAPFWHDFGSLSEYHVTLTNPEVPPCIVTKTGSKTVGGIFRNAASFGTLLLLPHIDFEDESFYVDGEAEGEAEGEEEGGEAEFWSESGRQFADKFIRAILALDSALRSGHEITPAPAWVDDEKYSTSRERDLSTQLLEAEKAVEEAQRRKEQLRESLVSAGSLKALLYEKGVRLELAIIGALRVMGFTAENYKNSDSEFDVVFESAEGRLVGEAEGKDTKAINIDKLRQLGMNIHEDLKREDVTTPAKPVLFGNGFRLQPISERGDPFTEKCHIAASSSLTALVATYDLFAVAQYLIDTPDADYAQICRQAILRASGRVIFPEIPQRKSLESIVTETDESQQ